MKGMSFKKAFLLSGILLLSVFVVIQLSWACDDDDKWDYDCHDKWHWDHHSEPCHPPKIQIVYLTYPDGSIEFEILGKNFDNGTRPVVVTLGGMYKLNVKDGYSDTRIIATLPLKDLKEEFKYGDYRLVVSTCHDSSCEYKYCKDYCFKCKDKHCRDYCSKCKDRYCKDKYCKDHEYKCRCKDRYSLTIADPSGTGTCPPAVTKLETVYETLGPPNTPDLNPPYEIVGIAKCSPGFHVTGGGFSLSPSIRSGTITESIPLRDTDGRWGWHVVGTVLETTAGDPTITVWAVCVCVDAALCGSTSQSGQ